MYVPTQARKVAPRRRRRALSGLGAPSFDCSFPSALAWWNSLSPDQVWGDADTMMMAWASACPNPGSRTPAPPPAAVPPSSGSTILDRIYNAATGRLTQNQVQQQVNDCVSAGLRAGGNLPDVQAGCAGSIRAAAGNPADNPGPGSTTNTAAWVLLAVGAAAVGISFVGN